ncbi:hypothetical protein JN01_0684 [Entomoplasma freundtii]|uniref:Uncharacterized protein n=1 Tax=Entomoplasma freundtii TaxID=74700 RepID=A0A2K8NRN6_9MOLU|nr:hypothetical protein [Entomoplasma freundtii]ATZ16469.1 hypothetical protein EFREU_v1c04430 [Entomoplasma freundtii]TDY55998.1 hypothetical protein JN01_0684 [Entomoplasma freundtii]
MAIKKIISCLSGIILCGNTTAITIGKEYSYKLIYSEDLTHLNLIENKYFSNEMLKAQLEYNKFNGRLKEEEHYLNFLQNNEENEENKESPFWGPVLDEEVFHESYTFQNTLFENRTNHDVKSPEMRIHYKNYSEKIRLSSVNSLSSPIEFIYNNKKIFAAANNIYDNNWTLKDEDLEEGIPSYTISSQRCVYSEIKIDKTIIYRQRFLYIPIENDQIFQKIIDDSGKKYSLTPRQLNNFLDNSINSEANFSYYLGNEEFFQSRKLIDDSSYFKESLIWVAWKFEEWETKIEGQTNFFVNKEIK